MRLRIVALALFALSAVASAFALGRMAGILDFVLIGPGYLVQSWLFERHLALGGLGYDATMIGVSALFWTSLLVGLYAFIRSLYRRLLRHCAA